MTAVLVAVALAAWVRVRPLPRWADAAPVAAAGAFHVHSEASHDSRLPRADIAAAAAACGLKFVVLTDHNRQQPAAQVGGVALLSSAELSTPDGHVIQLGARFVPDRASRHGPGLLAAIAADGGLPVLAHPSDPKRPWRGATAPVGGLEVANLASSARRAGGPLLLGLTAGLLAWPLNPELVLAQLLTADPAALARWDAPGAEAWIGLCGSDAHGWIDLGRNLAAWQVVLDDPWPADGDPAAVVARLRAGRFACVTGLLGRPPAIALTASRDGVRLGTAGDRLVAGEVDQLQAAAPATDRGVSEVVLYRDGREVARGSSPGVTLPAPGAGTYRAEVAVPLPRLLLGSRRTVVAYTNRITLAPPPPPPPP